MKRIYIIISALLFSIHLLFAQAPEKMSYQAVIRNINNTLVTNGTVTIRVSILQTSATGTSVYTETHSTTTNANGLLSIEIGSGTVVSGTFNTIDWGNGPYFIKTETDPQGGTSYSVTGTSELLSVPYAIYAETANSISGGETDPLFSASPASTITTTDITNWNTPLDSSAIAAMGFITSSPSTTYQVGDFAHGGIIVWLDETNQHGLVCTKTDLDSTLRWHAGTYGVTRSNGNGPYAGKANNSIIVSSQISIGDDGLLFAAAACNELQVTEGTKTYGDWYLPSINELEIIQTNLTIINASATANGGSSLGTSPYWSSTESSMTEAYMRLFNGGGGSTSTINKAATFNLRAFRSF